MSRSTKLPNYVVKPFGDLSKTMKKIYKDRERAITDDLDAKSYMGTFGLSIPDPIDYDFWEPESMTTRKRTVPKLQRHPKMERPKQNLGRFIRPNGNRRQQRIAREIKDRRVESERFDPWNERGEIHVDRNPLEGYKIAFYKFFVFLYFLVLLIT